MSEALTRPHDEHLARVKSALIAEAAGRAGTRIEGLDGLFAVVDERWPVSHDNNKVVVTQPVAPETLLEFADDSLGGAGLAHRQVVAFEGGDELALAAREAGYTVETLVVMTLDPEFDQAPRPDVDVREIDEDALSGVLAETWSAGNPEMTEETVRQLVARRAAFDAPVTAFAAFAEGRPVAHLDLRRRDGVAEIDNVGTLPDHRNHGYARALVLHAIARARSQGDDLIFLLADAEDWPRELYVKLGFGVIGEIHELHRPIAMTSDPEPAQLTDATGRTVLSYHAITRGGRDFADLAEVGTEGVYAAATAALGDLKGWGLATTDDALAAALLERGATLRRHAHVHSRDLRADPAPSAWAAPPLRDGLRITPWDRPLEEIAVVALAAYPADHPDFEPREGIADVVAQDLKPYAVDGALGPILPASGLVIEDDGGTGRVVALLLVNDREGVVPDGGPWVTDVGRLGGTAYAGTGRALLQRALAQLTADGQPALSLAVTNGNPARNLYEQLGIRYVYSAQTLLLP